MLASLGYLFLQNVKFRGNLTQSTVYDVDCVLDSSKSNSNTSFRALTVRTGPKRSLKYLFYKSIRLACTLRKSVNPE